LYVMPLTVAPVLPVMFMETPITSSRLVPAVVCVKATVGGK
jgi:hypothetical protein